jgi:hypothetical protein
VRRNGQRGGLKNEGKKKERMEGEESVIGDAA